LTLTHTPDPNRSTAIKLYTLTVDRFTFYVGGWWIGGGGRGKMSESHLRGMPPGRLYLRLKLDALRRLISILGDYCSFYNVDKPPIVAGDPHDANVKCFIAS